MRTVALVVGTRPEAIKMAPLLPALRSRGLRPVLVATAQHRGLLDQSMRILGLRPDFDLDLMRPGQTPAQVLSRLLEKLPPLLRRIGPRLVTVQGDTTS